MIKIKVKFFGPFHDLFGGREKIVDFSSDGRLVQFLERLLDTPDRKQQVFARTGELLPHVVVMLNGTPVPSPSGLNTSLQEGDIIAIFPFLGGG
jgi:molybdopterin converting factor small subunit